MLAWVKSRKQSFISTLPSLSLPVNHPNHHLFLPPTALSPPPPRPPPPRPPVSPALCFFTHSSAADLHGGERGLINDTLTDGLFGLQQRGIVVWVRDEVRGHSPESCIRQKPDHNRRLIIMYCCRTPAEAAPPHFHHWEPWTWNT